LAAVVCQLVLLAYILIWSLYGCARLVFGDEVLLEKELLIVNIVSFLYFNPVCGGRLSQGMSERLSFLEIDLVVL